MSPEQVESAVSALGGAHNADGDTVETAAASTGLPADKLQEIVGHLGGEGSLGQFATLLQGAGGTSGLMGVDRRWGGTPRLFMPTTLN